MTGIGSYAYVDHKITVDGGGTLTESPRAIPLERCAGHPVEQVGAKAAHWPDELEAAEITDEVSVTEHGSYPALIESASPLRQLVRTIESFDRPPVVIAPYPSLGLVPLIPYTAGFVFDHGNLLCHMAIVLRERGIPGYVIPSIFDEVTDGRPVTVGPDGVHQR